MLIAEQISFQYPGQDLLFNQLSFSIQNHDKWALLGANGVGKSTFLQLLAGHLQPTAGEIYCQAKPFYLPQQFAHWLNEPLIKLWRIDEVYQALMRLDQGQGSSADLLLVDNQWDLLTRIEQALAYWGMSGTDPVTQLGCFSGGEQVRLLLTGLFLQDASFLLLDEPGNHLDIAAKQQLISWLQMRKGGHLLVSHDPELLGSFDEIVELTSKGLCFYGGDFAFYLDQRTQRQKNTELALSQHYSRLKQAKMQANQLIERNTKAQIRGKQQKIKAGVPKIMMGKLKENAENNQGRLQIQQDHKLQHMRQSLNQLQLERLLVDRLQFRFSPSQYVQGVRLLEVKDLQFNLYQQPLWEQALSFNLSSGERLGVYGPNGSGKSTLLRLLLGQIAVETNHLWRKPMGVFYLDQQYAGLQTNQSILELVKATADPAFNEAEIHTTLHQFLFPVASWAKAVISLSGGEKLRLQLCIQQLSRRFTDLVVLDEPANNLDIDNVEVLVKAINSYTGSLIVVSHQQDLFEQLGVEKRLHLPAGKLI